MRSRFAHRRVAVVVGIIVAVAAAAAVIALAVAALTAGKPDDAVSSASEPVTATDFCFVESMIYYRVESRYLSDALLDKNAISPEAREFAEALVADQSELDEGFRPWYVSWKEFRPLEPPEEGPCAGHGNHRQMPGMPTVAQWDALIAADGAEAERLFAEYLIAQDQAMIEFAQQVLATDPHSRVRESATQVIEDAEREIAALEELLAGLP